MRNIYYAHAALFIFVRTVINTALRMVYPFLRVFGRGLGVDLPKLSLALTLRSMTGVAGPFIASIADRRGRKTGMLFGLSLFTVGIGLMALWPSYVSFVAALILSIAGNFAFVPSMQAYFGDRVPYQQRGFVLGLTEFGWSLSFIIGVPLVGLCIAKIGWQAPFLFLAVLGLLAIIVLALILPNEAGDGAPKNILNNLQTVLTSSLALAGITLSVCIGASNEMVNIIFGVWMEDSFNVQIAALATTSAIIGISELSGEGLSSAFVDRIGKVRSIRAGIIANSLATLSLPILGKSLVGAVAGLFILYLTFEFLIVSSIPLMTEILPQARATLMAAFTAGTAIGRGIGALVGPVLYSLEILPDSFSGMYLIAPAAVLVNFLGLLALQRMRQLT